MLRPTLHKDGSYGPYLGRDWRFLSEMLKDASDVLLKAAPRRHDYVSRNAYLSDVQHHREMLDALGQLQENAQATYSHVARQYSASRSRDVSAAGTTGTATSQL